MSFLADTTITVSLKHISTVHFKHGNLGSFIVTGAAELLGGAVSLLPTLIFFLRSDLTTFVAIDHHT
jgi:hypothetical protein